MCGSRNAGSAGTSEERRAEKNREECRAEKKSEERCAEKKSGEKSEKNRTFRDFGYSFNIISK